MNDRKRTFWRARSKLLAAGVPWEKVKAMDWTETVVTATNDAAYLRDIYGRKEVEA